MIGVRTERDMRQLAAPFVVTALASSGALILTLGWSLPLWAVGVATILPWVPLFTLQVAVTYQRYQWLALFYLLVVTQTGHFFEHVSQMIQIHVMGLTGADARGIIGTLDIEWVHFVWNAWVFVAVVWLLVRFRDNRWLWLALVLTGWHMLEHAYIFRVYLATGVSGTPGLLSQGGLLMGGLPLARPDLHFVYNLIETIPLIAGFLVESARRRAPRARQTSPTRRGSFAH